RGHRGRARDQQQHRGNAPFGVDNTTSTEMDARGNWWGCAAGPPGAGCDMVNGPVDTSSPLPAPPVCPPPTTTTTTTSTTTTSAVTTTTVTTTTGPTPTVTTTTGPNPTITPTTITKPTTTTTPDTDRSLSHAS